MAHSLRLDNTSQTTLLENIAAERDNMVALTSELVAIPTENPPGNSYDDAKEFLCRRLEAIGFEDTRVEGDCVLSFAGNGDRTVYFSGHYDVVPAQDPAQFEPRVKGPNLFGRGSSDMKSGLAAMAYAAKAARDAGLLSNGRIGLVFVPDEETAGPRGSRYLTDRGILGLNGIAMLTPEPTGGVVWNANRGAITLKITVPGKPAHVGRQCDGVNAFERMLPIAQALMSLKHDVECRSTAYKLLPEAARRSILMLGGRVEGGTNFNVVPDSCSFTVDRRINPEEDFETERTRLFDCIRNSGVDANIEVLQEGRSCGVPEEGPAGSALARSIQTITGESPRFEMCPGLLEIRFYAAQGIPAFAYGPGLLTVSHGPNEFVPIDRIVQCARIYALTALDLLTSG